jgi:hypothetical protein
MDILKYALTDRLVHTSTSTSEHFGEEVRIYIYRKDLNGVISIPGRAWQIRPAGCGVVSCSDLCRKMVSTV